jgi:hypothetical protein
VPDFIRVNELPVLLTQDTEQLSARLSRSTAKCGKFKLSQPRGSPQKRVANLWTEFAAHECEAAIANGKKPQNPSKLVVAATFEKAKT